VTVVERSWEISGVAARRDVLEKVADNVIQLPTKRITYFLQGLRSCVSASSSLEPLKSIKEGSAKPVLTGKVEPDIFAKGRLWNRGCPVP